MEKDEIIEFKGRQFQRLGIMEFPKRRQWYLLGTMPVQATCDHASLVSKKKRELLREIFETPQPDLLAEAAHAIECVWAGVPDGVRRSLAAGADNLRSNSIVVIPVLPEVLREIESVLARIRAAKEGKS